MMHMHTPSQTLQHICSSFNVTVAVIKLVGWGLPRNRWVQQLVICLAFAASLSIWGLVFLDTTDGMHYLYHCRCLN